MGVLQDGPDDKVSCLSVIGADSVPVRGLAIPALI